MVPRTPTRRQRLLASDWLPRLVILGGPLLFTMATVRSIGPGAFSSIWTAGLTIVVGLLSFTTGLFVGIPLVWILFGPTLMDQGQRNGGPFEPGDLVQVLCGPHRGEIARVYSTWQHETVRVDLGEDAKAQFRDIFAAYQLLRIDAPADAAAPPTAGSLSG